MWIDNTLVIQGSAWKGTAIDAAHGGTGATSAAQALINLGGQSTKGYYTYDPGPYMSNGDIAFWWDGADMWFVYKQSGNRFRVAMQSN
ncbi:MAG: hypothetical protein M1541_04315 [Acidobacteria bacterium]|nr:hypothetical protein [Acidobacteriota bacterium]